MCDFSMGPGQRLASSSVRLPLSEGQAVGTDGLQGGCEPPVLRGGEALPASCGWGKGLDLPPPIYHPLFSCRSWPRSRPTGPGPGRGAPTMAGLKGATQRPRSPSPGALASHHPTVPSAACPLAAATAATTPAPCLSYPSALPKTLRGTALPPKLVSQWLKTPGVGASSLSCATSCNWSQAPTPFTVSWG